MEVEARATEQREAKATEQKEARETDQRETEADAESEMEKEAFTGLEKRAVEDDAYEEECTVMERELFFDEKPLYDVFFSLVLGRCQDVVISIRGEATHCIGLLLGHINSVPDCSLRCVLDDATCDAIVSTITARISDSAVVVRKNALNGFAECIMNEKLRKSMNDDAISSLICEMLQDSAASVKRAALALYYRLVPIIPTLTPLFFSISLSMFENSNNTDTVILKNCQAFVFEKIIQWKTDPSVTDGWRFMEYFNSGNVYVLESILKAIVDKNALNLHNLMRSCIAAVEWSQEEQESSLQDNESLLVQMPHIEVNAWLLLSLIAKYHKRMDVQFIQNQLAALIASCATSRSVVRDKFILQTAIHVAPKMDEKTVKSLYVSLVRQLLKLQMPLDTIHSYLRLYLCFLDCLYHDPKKIQKAASLFVVKVEDKVDKILRSFIFKSGGKIQNETISQTQKTQTFSQDFHDPLIDPLAQEDELEGNVSETHECSLLVEDADLQWLFPWIFIVGELAVLGMEESEEGNLSKLNIRIRDKTVTLLKSLTTNSLPMVNPKQAPILIPSCIRAHAMISFGKLCITSTTLAKKHLPMFIRELEVSKDSVIRNNIIIVIGDICTKHTSIVERYIPTIANCIIDPDVIVRIHSLSMISKLVLEDFIKLKPVLLCCMLCSLVDEDDSIAAFAYHLITKQIHRKFPKIFATSFVEIMSILNGYLDNNLVKKEFGANMVDINLGGGDRRHVNARKRIYRIILELEDDESKLQISCKLCQNVLGPLVDNDEIENMRNDPNAPELNLVKDAFAVLCSKELKVGSKTRAEDEDLPPGILESKKTVLTKLEKRTMLEQVLPLLVSLKLQLEKKKSVLLRDLMLYLKVITVNFKQEMDTVFSDNPRLKREIEYDLRKFDESGEGNSTPQKAESITAVNTLATPLLTRSHSNNPQVATPRLKTNLRDSLGSVQEDTEKRSGSLEVHLSLPSNQEEEKWQIDARRLSFSTPTKEQPEKEKDVTGVDIEKKKTKKRSRE